ncbi:hypothetical protein B0H19DRAFT_1067600 [Mycena capillaripes]|nr:hypothetical protein B0H19DRAFT_1067600 [Mycena capillaripes]
MPQTLLDTSFNVPPQPPASTVVCAGAIVRLDNNLNEQQRYTANNMTQSDVLNALLAAELSAEHDHPKEDSTKNLTGWYKQFIDVLSNLGWIFQGFEFKQVALNQSGGSIVDSAVEALEQDPVVTKDLLANLTRAMLKLYGSGPESNAAQVFAMNSLGPSHN